MEKPLLGRLGYWLREPSDTSEGTISAIVDTVKNTGGGSNLSPKVADGLNFQGANDSSYPCNSVSDILALKKVCEDKQCTFLPVVVPRLLNAGDVVKEAALHASIAQACGSLMLDLEVGQGFVSRAQDVPLYAQTLRQQVANSAYLILEPDPRVPGLTSIQFQTIVQYFDAICGQHYVGWTDVGWTNVAYEVQMFNWLALFGKDMYVTLYGAGDLSLPVQFWAQVKQAAKGVVVFDIGPMNATDLAAFAMLDLSGLPKPEPFPQPTPIPIDDTAFRLNVGYLAAATASDATNTSVALTPDILATMRASAQSIIDQIAALKGQQP